MEFSLEAEKIKQDCENEIKLARMQLEKENMDEHMLRHEALKLAKASLTGRCIEKTNITAMPASASTDAILAGVLGKIGVTKNAMDKAIM